MKVTDDGGVRQSVDELCGAPHFGFQVPDVQGPCAAADKDRQGKDSSTDEPECLEPAVTVADPRNAHACDDCTLPVLNETAWQPPSPLTQMYKSGEQPPAQALAARNPRGVERVGLRVNVLHHMQGRHTQAKKRKKNT